MGALRYAIEEAVASLWRGRRSASLSIGTITIVLFILGCFLFLTTNIEHLTAEWRQTADLSVFLADDLSDGDRRTIEALLAPGAVVAGTEFVSKAQALSRFKQMFGDLALADGVAPGPDDNPLPASFEVHLQPAGTTAGIEALAERLRQTPGVSDVRYDRQWLDRLASALVLLRGIGLIVGGLLTIAAALTVANVVRLALHARRDELEIMQLVGAPLSFVRGPFVLEGLLHGGLGGLLALGALAGGYFALRGQYLAPLSATLNVSPFGFLPVGTSLWLLGGGLAVGCIGGLLAARFKV
jgi:cell division transport system permease protein